MKTKELIKILQDADPEGETECCIGNEDIHYVTVEPAYWDGRLQVLERDHSKNPYYNIIGGKYTTRGHKVLIRPISITEAICTAVEFGQEFPVDYSELGNAELAARYKESNEKTRKQMENIEYQGELRMFVEHIKKRALEITSETSGLERYATAFFDESKIDRHDPIPADISAITMTSKSGANTYNSHLSYHDQRNIQWDREIDIAFDGMDWQITKRF